MTSLVRLADQPAHIRRSGSARPVWDDRPWTKRLSWLRAMTLGDPVAALQILQRRGVADHVVCETLRAEAYLRVGQRGQAVTAAITAVSTAGHETPLVPIRLMTAATVLVDVSHCAGDWRESARCLRLLERTGLPIDRRRELLDDALHAVDIYHRRDCREGCDVLDGLLHRYRWKHGDDQFAVMLAVGLSAMAEQCVTPPHAASRATRLGPVPGGLLRPDLTRPARWYLRGRVEIRVGAHHHSPHPAASTWNEA